MTGSLLKNIFREIKNSKPRFFSIMAIIALGVGFFAGIKATSPSMNAMAESYYSESNLMDFRLLSTVGFDDDDVNAVKNTDGVTDVMPSYFADVIINFGTTGNAVRLIANPTSYNDNKELNSLTVLDGRLPEKSGEIAVENGNFADKKLQIGDTINIENYAGDNNIGDTLNTLEYTVVGIVKSPLYISYERGITTIGNGKLSSFMYISPEDFKTEKYSELYVKTNYSDAPLSPFSDEYIKGIDEVKEKLQITANTQIDAFNKDVVAKAQQEIDDGWQDYYSQKSDTNAKLNDSKSLLLSSQETYNEKIQSAQNDINDAQQKLDDGETTLNNSINEYNSKISQGESALELSQEELSLAKSQYETSKAQFNSEIALAQSKIDDGLSAYNEAYTAFYSQVKPYLLYSISLAQAGLNEVMGNIETVKAQIEYLEQTSPDEAGKIAELKAMLTALENKQAELVSTIDDLNNKIYIGETALSQTKEQIDLSQQLLNTQKQNGELQLSNALLQIEQGQQKLENGAKELENSKTSATSQLENAQQQLDTSRQQLEDAKKQLEQQKQEGQEKIDDGWQDYYNGLSTAQTEFANAEEKLNNSQSQLDKYKDAKWILNTREDNPGYSAFTQNTKRLDAVASVFPIFFLLVAVLVCLTTMTRLIEEERTEIGTFKALGYSDKSIISKFLIYSSIAGISGSVIGIIIGVSSLPFIIYNAYKMMYTMKDISLVLDWTSIVFGLLAALLCTVTVSIVVCINTLHHKPSTLMRPKAPKAGKKILLERITPLWKKFSFTSKVTARNLFRYKSRLFMTVLGVAGCTALIVAAFGLLNSFTPLTSTQFETIFMEDAAIVPKQAGTAEELESLCSAVASDNNISSYSLVNQTAVTAENNKCVKDKDTNICIPENIDNFKNLVSLHTRVGQTPIELTDNGVVINEKMAEEMSVSVGDTITLVYNDTTAQVTVSAICENYIRNYVYMTKNYFESTFNQDITYNSIFVKAVDKSNLDSIGSSYLERDDVTAVSFISTGVNQFDNMLKSLNMVVIVMIICAGALAFVVLYNLTNINMGERIREIATIKVLGFYNRETAAYIYRENIALTIMGIVVGLFMGKALTTFIVLTVEVDNIMFGRDIFFTSYLYATLITAFFSAIVNVFMYFKMKKINMVESLKSIE